MILSIGWIIVIVLVIAFFVGIARFGTTRRAWFFDSRGEYHGKKMFSKHASTIKYKDKTFIVDLDATYKKDYPFIISWIWERRTYFYNIDNPAPLKLDKKGIPILTPEMLQIQLDTKIARDLNDLAKKNAFLAMFTPKRIILIALGALVVYLLLSGQLFHLFGGSGVVNAVNNTPSYVLPNG